MPLNAWDVDWHEASLRVVTESMEVHRVKRAQFATDVFTVKRNHLERRDSIDG